MKWTTRWHCSLTLGPKFNGRTLGLVLVLCVVRRTGFVVSVIDCALSCCTVTSGEPGPEHQLMIQMKSSCALGTREPQQPPQKSFPDVVGLLLQIPVITLIQHSQDSTVVLSDCRVSQSVSQRVTPAFTVTVSDSDFNWN